MVVRSLVRYATPTARGIKATSSITASSSTAPVQPQSCRHLPELSNLSDATSRLNFRSLPYGSPSNLLFPPSSSINASYHCPLFILRAFPAPSRRSAIPRPILPTSLTLRPTPPPTLHHTTSPHTLTAFLSEQEMRERKIMLKRYRKPFTMDLTIMAGKKKVHKSAVVRERCKRRLKEAIRMVVMRGAHKDDDGIGFDPKKEGAGKWLVSGFSYIASATLELYLHPFPDLIDQVGRALSKIKQKAENDLFELELSKIPAPPPDPPAGENV